MTTEAITPLRQRMIEDMNSRKLGTHTQRSHPGVLQEHNWALRSGGKRTLRQYSEKPRAIDVIRTKASKHEVAEIQVY